jgi:tetratricopeptide (TPR) repeat protein
VVSDWDGHALTISLLGSYLAEKHGGDIAHLAEIPIPTADEPRYERVHRVLRRYDEHLTETEREFLKLFSAFRTPVHEGAFEKVFVPLLPKVGATHPAQTKTKPGKASKQKKTTDGIDGSPLRDVVTRLVSYRILRHDTASQTYTAHPLVRNHYLSILTHGDSTQQHGVHNKIKDYYLFIAGDTPQYPTLDDLKPLIEVVHHACQAGAYDEAYEIRRDRIDQGTSFILGHQLGAYETQLSIQTEFFPDKDLSQEPQPKNLVYKRWILNTIGFCLMSLGRLREAVPFYERVIKAGLAAEDWHNISVDNQNLAELHAQLGALEASAEAARQALDLARHAENKRDEKNSQRGQAWAEHLLGNLDVATSIFIQIETLEQEEYLQENIRYLFSTRGINHADHLRRTGKPDYARRVTKANLAWWVKNYKWPKDESSCLRILGDLNSDSGNHESARAHYESALKIARSISHRQVLIEALLARGRFLAKMAVGVGSSDPGRDDLAPTVTDAFNDLNEALNYAVEGGYRIYEADIRVALAWAHLAASSTLSAKAEAERALQMSQEMGYHWGVVDAEEVLKNV